jgi:hypothetical protein
VTLAECDACFAGLMCKIPRIPAFVRAGIGCNADLRRAAFCSGDGSPSGHDAIELQIFESDVEKVCLTPGKYFRA